MVARLRPRGGLGGYLHELRRERGLTVRRLAAAAGVHHTYISKLERGDRQAPDEPVVEALAAALGATPAQIDQLRWRAGLRPRGAGAPAPDDPTVTLVAEALGDPSLQDAARDRLRRAIAQAVMEEASPQHRPPWDAPASRAAAPPPAAATPLPASLAGTPYAHPALPPYAAPPPLSPDAPPDARGALLAGMLGGWQTVEEAAAELRVTPAYLLSLVRARQLSAWSLPGGQSPQVSATAGLRLRREDVISLLRPVQL